MRLRGIIKHFLHGSKWMYSGGFPYFTQEIFFPRGSQLFDRVCDEGVFEYDTVRLLRSLASPGTTYFDVGANIGLLAVPVLQSNAEVHVISIEASPDTIGYLRRTQQNSSFRDRWSIVECAVGSAQQSVRFFVSAPKNGAYDGLRDTGRGDAKRDVTVEMRTLDSIWRDAGMPTVSVVKIDVEGGESEVLLGASSLISRDRPALIIEWNEVNLKAYGIEPDYLLRLCDELGYFVQEVPKMYRIDREELLKIAMSETETFLLLPNKA